MSIDKDVAFVARVGFEIAKHGEPEWHEMLLARLRIHSAGRDAEVLAVDGFWRGNAEQFNAACIYLHQANGRVFVGRQLDRQVKRAEFWWRPM